MTQLRLLRLSQDSMNREAVWYLNTCPTRHCIWYWVRDFFLERICTRVAAKTLSLILHSSQKMLPPWKRRRPHPLLVFSGKWALPSLCWQCLPMVPQSAHGSRSQRASRSCDIHRLCGRPWESFSRWLGLWYPRTNLWSFRSQVSLAMSDKIWLSLPKLVPSSWDITTS